jgi:C-terminal processing protease CtpA/Prc
MVGYLVSAFTPKGANIYNTFRRRDGSDSEAPRDAYAHPRLSVPLYILISAHTGSAAESFAYTLKNAGRATIVGETSGGAANPGGPVNVGNGFSVFVPTGSPISPITNTNWEGTGVVPDVKVAPAAALGAARTLALQALNKRSEQN